MKFKSLELINFQVHEHTVLDFSPSITTIKGATDKGKSSILRALRWLCLNDFAGTDFIRENETETSIKLVVVDKKNKSEVVRTRGARLNTYELDDKEYKAFGQAAVPSDIENLLRLNEINFQGQHDAPFWFNEPAPEVSRKLNAVIDLSVIDTTLANVATELRRAQERKDVIEERLEQAKEQLKEAEPQRKRIDDFLGLEKLHKSYTSAEGDSCALEGYVERIRSCRDKARNASERSEQGAEVLTEGRFYLESVRIENKIRDVLTAIEEVNKYAKPPPDFKLIEKAFNDWRSGTEDCIGLRNLIGKVELGTQAKKKSQEAAQAAETKFHKQTKNRRCPLCGKMQ